MSSVIIPPRRLGTFRMTRDLIEELWPTIAAMLKIVVVDARMEWPDVVRYTAYCEEFAISAVGEIPPEYQLLFTRNEHGSVTMEWKKV